MTVETQTRKKLLDKFGIRISNGYRKTLLCSCGHKEEKRTYENNVCTACGNERFKEMLSQHFKKNKTFIGDAKFSCMEKTEKTFKVTKKEIMVTVNDDDTMIFEEGKEMEMEADLINKTVTIIKNGRTFKNANEKQIDDFIKGSVMENDIISTISTDTNREYYNFIYSYLGAMHGEFKNKFSRALLRSFRYPSLEISYYAGLPLNMIWQEHEWRDSKETKPHKILSIPKYLVPYLKKMNYFRKYHVQQLLKAEKAVSSNNLKTILEILEEEATIDDFFHLDTDFQEMYITHGFKDVKKFFLYICREVKLQQGITQSREALMLIRDYVRMSKAMDYDFEKFPKSLKKEHDIALMNYKAKEDEYKKKQFLAVIEEKEYKELEMKSKEYSVIKPEESNDLIKEGSGLSHCVASYVDDVINKKCKILFMRKTKEIETSLITIEVRGDSIRQVKGSHNRRPNGEEMSFVRLWAEKKKLNLNTY